MFTASLAPGYPQDIVDRGTSNWYKFLFRKKFRGNLVG